MSKPFETENAEAKGAYLDHIWACLNAGAGPGRSPFTLMQAATVGLDGSPQVRTVVLRKANREADAIWFHTDVRSPKVAELRADPRISLLAYDPETNLQIRVQGSAMISDDESDRRAMWTSSRPHTLTLYRSPCCPSTEIARPSDAYPESEPELDTDAAATKSGYAHFALVRVSIDRFDVLHIKSEGHQRCVLNQSDTGWQAHWVSP